jgi:predicted RNA methylase
MVGCTQDGDAAVQEEPLAAAQSADDPVPPGEVKEFTSAYLASPLQLYEGVFPPTEAEVYVLPFMTDHPELFRGKRVYEIGTGSGIIALYAAQLGATAVVCTDISTNALTSVRRNAERMGFADIIDARLVPESDMSAYSTVKAGEVFDTIISNPPYALDLDATRNTPVVDKGDLGFSIVRGFKQHLAPDGIATLFYNTLFYHHVMVKFARYEGYEVRTHTPLGMSPYSFNALFNLYLERLLEHEQIPSGAFRFEREELPYAIVVDEAEHVPLIGEGKVAKKVYRGFMTIRR